MKKGSYYDRVEDFERKLVLEALSITQGNYNRAAQILGVHRTTLVEISRRLGLIEKIRSLRKHIAEFKEGN